MEIDIIGIILEIIFAPSVLFFIFGMVSVFVKSDISIPSAMSTSLIIFLLASIGLKGGVEAVESLVDCSRLIGVVLMVAIFTILCGAAFAYLTAHILKKVVGLKTADAWAAGGHYGAVSSATLAISISIANAAQEVAAEGVLIFGGWMSAMHLFMMGPSLIIAILFGRMALAKEGINKGIKVDIKKILHHSIFGMAVWLLVVSLLIGMASQLWSPREMDGTMAFFDGMFHGVLALFLIDMGLAAGRQFRALKELGGKFGIAVLIAFLLPQVWGIIGILGMYVINLAIPDLLGWGDAFVFATIAGGCSFISAPAAMRASIPEANPSIYLSMSVALTFPFNIIIGIPLWQILSMILWGAY